jgi:NitT/TauT family transport system permease protein
MAVDQVTPFNGSTPVSPTSARFRSDWSVRRAPKASARGVLTKIRFPCALPSLFAGIKIAISFAMVGAIVGKFVVGSRGTDLQILLAQGQFDTVRLLVSLLLLGRVGKVLFLVVDHAERLCLPWPVSQRARHARSAACP